MFSFSSAFYFSWTWTDLVGLGRYSHLCYNESVSLKACLKNDDDLVCNCEHLLSQQLYIDGYLSLWIFSGCRCEILLGNCCLLLEKRGQVDQIDPEEEATIDP